MAKAVKKKSAKEASSLFHNIMAASVKGNPKPVKNITPLTIDDLTALRSNWIEKTSKRMRAEEGIAFLNIRIGDNNARQLLRLTQILETAKKEERLAKKEYEEAFSLVIQQKSK